MFPDEEVFSAQENEGFLIFKPLAPDVNELTVHIPDVVVRFDYKGDPIEDVDVQMHFERRLVASIQTGARWRPTSSAGSLANILRCAVSL